MTVSYCPRCGKRSYLMPLHGNKGGPLLCPLCVVAVRVTQQLHNDMKFIALEKPPRPNAMLPNGSFELPPIPATREMLNPLTACAACGEGFKAKRKDARFCSDRCRQKAHRRLVTDKNSAVAETYKKS